MKCPRAKFIRRKRSLWAILVHLPDLRSFPRAVPESQKRPTWWESQLETIARDARSYVAARFPALGSLREDVVNEALTDFVQRLSDHREGYPASWFTSQGPSDEGERTYLPRLARTILNRRIADQFRRQARQWAQETSFDETAESLPGATFEDHERRLTLLRMLKVCMETLASMPDEDRQLIAFLTEAAGKDTPLTDAQRQRLHRLRVRLAEAIRARLGESVASLLKKD